MHASLEPGGVLLVFPQCDERAIYLADPKGTLMVGHVEVPPLGAAVIAPGEEVQVYSPTGATDVLVIGGARLDAPVKHWGWPAWDAVDTAPHTGAVSGGGDASNTPEASGASVIHQWHDLVARAPVSTAGCDPTGSGGTTSAGSECGPIANAKQAWERQDTTVFPSCE